MIKNLFKIYSLTSTSTKLVLYLLILMTFAIGFLEILSLGMVIPILDQILSTQTENFFLNKYFQNLNIEILLTIFAASFILKNLILIFFQKIKFKFLSRLLAKIINKMLIFFLNKNLSYLKNIKRGELTRDILNEPKFFFKNFFMNLIDISFEIFLLTLILSFLFLVNVKSTIIVCLMVMIINFAAIYYSKNKIKFFGETRVKFSKDSLQSINETFNLIKEIKIFNKEETVYGKFNKKIKNLISAELLPQYYVLLPRIFMETTIIIFVIGLLFFYSSEKNYIDAFGLIGVYALAALRLLPSVSKIVQGYQRYKYSDVTTKNILDKLVNSNNLQKFNSKEIFFNNAIKFDGIDIEILKNDKICIIGETGAGKTTMLNTILGLNYFDINKVSLDGKKINFSLNEWQNLFSYLPQNFFLINDTIKNNITFLEDRESFNTENYNKCLKNADCNFIKKLDKGEDFIIGENGEHLSGGERQKIAIARGLYQDKSILIFDESTNQINKDSEKIILNNLTKLNKIIIFVTHDHSNLEYFNKVYEVKNRKLKKIR